MTQNLRPFQFTVEDDVPLESSSPSPCISAHTRYSHVGHWLITQSRSLPRGCLWTGALDGQRGYPLINTLNRLPSLPCFTCLLLLVLPGITFHVNCCYLVTKSCLTLRAHGLWPTRLLCPWDFLGKKTGVGCHFLLQGIFAA